MRVRRGRRRLGVPLVACATSVAMVGMVAATTTQANGAAHAERRMTIGADRATAPVFDYQQAIRERVYVP